MPNFHATDGVIHWRTTKIERPDAEWLLDLFNAELNAYLDIGAFRIATATLALCDELAEAMSRADTFMRTQ